MYGDLLVSWMEGRFGPGLELIATYVDDVEAECDRSVAIFKASNDGYEHPVGMDEAGNEQVEWVTVHKGLSDNAWCLPEIFEHYFPTLKRGSALTALCGYMEHELNELCREIRSQLVITVGVEDMKGQGVTRAALYLQKIGNVVFDFGKNHEWKKMQEAFLLRNAIVHAGARVERPTVEEIVRTSKFLSCVDGQIDILNGHLRTVIDDFAAVGRVLDQALKSRFAKDLGKP
ncbi:hypothetical protein [Paraburkholderia caledonica]|uniref:hypothetical protein n=1 Tax=Paraburkholderia caledonica TaxID=134536 RepID=UPI000DEF9CFA|nr:hypothetical protein [Paraburkholderia caledonica]AXF18780.1 hypothetical protein CUJ87_30885 [Paraburkholderia caledonica]